MLNPAPVRENNTHKLLLDFDIHTDHLISARPNNNQQKEENLQNCDFAVPADNRINLKECEKKDKYLDLARELKKTTMEHTGDIYTSCNWCVWNSN